MKGEYYQLKYLQRTVTAFKKENNSCFRLMSKEYNPRFLKKTKHVNMRKHWFSLVKYKLIKLICTLSTFKLLNQQVRLNIVIPSACKYIVNLAFSYISDGSINDNILPTKSIKMCFSHVIQYFQLQKCVQRKKILSSIWYSQFFKF